MIEATCIISSHGRILRNRKVTTFEQVAVIHAQLPKNDIAMFENPDGEGGAMWAFFPELDDPRYWTH